MVAAAKDALARDFDVVGVTEEMDAFKALAALALGWPLELMCNAPALVSGGGGGIAVSASASAAVAASSSPRTFATPTLAANNHANDRNDVWPDAVRADLARLLAAEVEVYEYAHALHMEQRHASAAFGEAWAQLGAAAAGAVLPATTPLADVAPNIAGSALDAATATLGSATAAPDSTIAAPITAVRDAAAMPVHGGDQGVNGSVGLPEECARGAVDRAALATDMIARHRIAAKLANPRRATR